MTSASHWPLTALGGLVSLLNMFLPLVLVRVLSQLEMGEYKIYFLYLALLPWAWFTAGIPNGLSHWAGHDQWKVRATRVSWTLLVTMTAVGVIAGLLLAPWFAPGMGWTPGKVRLLAMGAGVAVLSPFFDEVSIAWGSVARGALMGAGFDLMRNLAMVGAAIFFRRIEAVFWAHILVFSAKLILGSIWGRRLGFQYFLFDGVILRKVLKYAFPVSAAAALSIATGYADQLLLSRLLPSDEFALFSFGCLLVPPLMIFEQSVNKVFIPKLSRWFASAKGFEEKAKAQDLYASAVGELAWLHIPAAVGLMVFAEPIVELLYTDRYLGAAPFLRLYALHYIVNHLPYDVVDRAKGRSHWILKRLAGASLVSPLLVVIGFWLWGAKGALLGAVTGNFLMRWSSLVTAVWFEKWEWKRFLPWRDYVVYSLISFVLALGSRSVRDVFDSKRAWFICCGSAFGILYLALTLYLKRTRRDRNHQPEWQQQVAI